MPHLVGQGAGALQGGPGLPALPAAELDPAQNQQAARQFGAQRRTLMGLDGSPGRGRRGAQVAGRRGGQRADAGCVPQQRRAIQAGTDRPQAGRDPVRVLQPPDADVRLSQPRIDPFPNARVGPVVLVVAPRSQLELTDRGAPAGRNQGLHSP